MALPGAVRTVIAADFDNDGFEELFFNNLGEPNRLFRAATGEPRADWLLADPGAAAEPDGLGTGAAVADIDGDGLLELLVAHGESTVQPLSLFKWPDDRPRLAAGAAADAVRGAGRGARVRLTAGGRTQLRVIDGGSGYLCQMEPVAHFGLGARRRGRGGRRHLAGRGARGRPTAGRAGGDRGRVPGRLSSGAACDRRGFAGGGRPDR